MKKHYKFILGIVIGLIISGVVGYAQTVLTSKEVVYDNTNSKLSSTNVKDAIDEVNTKATKKVEEAKKECPDGYVCRVNQFARDSWATIAANVKAGNAGAYQVGDTKEIDMGSLGTHTVRVANTSSCTNGETSETACGFVVEFADIISKQRMKDSASNEGEWPSNEGGWPTSEVRTYVNGTVYNALPSDLQNAIVETTVVSGHSSCDSDNFVSNDKLYLLSSKELYDENGAPHSVSYDTAASETRQLDYYKNKGVTISNSRIVNYSVAKKQYNGSNVGWLLRTAHAYDTRLFFGVGDDGSWYNYGADMISGVSPAFRIA